MKKYRLGLTATATVRFDTAIMANDLEHARKKFAELFKYASIIHPADMPFSFVVEYPSLHNDFELEDIECEIECEEKLK